MANPGDRPIPTPDRVRFDGAAPNAGGARRFSEEARRQSAVVANSPHAEADQEFVDAIGEFWTG